MRRTVTHAPVKDDFSEKIVNTTLWNLCNKQLAQFQSEVGAAGLAFYALDLVSSCPTFVQGYDDS